MAGKSRHAWLPWMLLPTGLALILAAGLSHRSQFPKVLNLYSFSYALMLGGLVLVFLLAAILALGFRQTLERILTKNLDRSPWFCRCASLLFSFTVVGWLLSLFFVELLTIYFTKELLIFGQGLSIFGLAMLFSRILPKSKSRLFWGGVGLMLFCFCLFALAVEVVFRLQDKKKLYWVYPPNVAWTFVPDTEALPGIEGKTLFTTNRDGIRGEDFPLDDRTRILAIGGSTTECTFLDDRETWTYLLQEELNGKNLPAWVGSIGRSGHGVVEHILAVKHFVPQHRFDCLVLLMGINDMMPAFWFPESYSSAQENPENYLDFLEYSFVTRPLHDPRQDRAFPQNTALFNLGSRSLFLRRHHIPRFYQEDQAGKNYNVRRDKFLNAPRVLQEMPSLTEALAQYRKNLHTLFNAGERQGLRMIVGTQPVVWRKDLSEEEEQRLWFGIYGGLENPLGRYELDTLAEGLEHFNQVLREVAAERGLTCVDLAADMSGNPAYFYDDVHFNEAGARRVASLMAKAFGKEMP